jgi:transposase, IS5 family
MEPRLSYPLASMLRIHLMQQGFSLSDPFMEDAPNEVHTIRCFAGINLNSGRIPNKATILGCRHLTQNNNLGKEIPYVAKANIKQRLMSMKQGTIFDATLISAPSSTKQTRCTGPRDAADKEQQSVAFRNESQYRCIQGIRLDPHGGNHLGQCA